MLYSSAVTSSKRAAGVFDLFSVPSGTARRNSRSKGESVLIFCLRKFFVTQHNSFGWITAWRAGKSEAVVTPTDTATGTIHCTARQLEDASPRRAANRDQVPFASVVFRRRRL
jgi:hypothetical protein